MHSLAISLSRAGHMITGSDDEIFDPAGTKLAEEGLLPENQGWFPEKITADLDIVILGMHAHKDNPELQKALDSGIKVYSYPEFLYNQTLNKKRVVIAGSHGKTTITSMVMHVLNYHGYGFDYMAGSKPEGFDNMVRLSGESGIAVFEGDEYLSSCVDPRPKFHVYQPQLALISGIAWDHINVFPTWQNYVDQFRTFISGIPAGGCLVYCDEDTELRTIAVTNKQIRVIPYTTPSYTVKNGTTGILHNGRTYELKIFGRHNMQNLEGARHICNELGISDILFYEAITYFSGAVKRLQMLGKNEHTAVFLDFAHSPSKVEATVNAVREQFSGRKVIACLELHTYSSLNKNFLDQYRNSMNRADTGIVYYSPDTVLHKRLPMITPDDITKAFGRDDLHVFTVRNDLEEFIRKQQKQNSVVLLMSSGNFSGIDFKTFTEEILN